MKRLVLACLLILVGAGHCSTIIEREVPKPLKKSNTLGTGFYRATQTEQSYFQKLDSSEPSPGGVSKADRIQGRIGKYVTWCGIVRGISKDEKVPGQYHLLIEHKYFDGFTDSHIMLVSWSGSGDFQVTVTAEDAGSIPLLSLVKVYGTVTSEVDGLPKVEAEYVRVWPWLTFTMMELGPEDHSNPKWRKLCELCKYGHIYDPYPTEQWYLKVLGDPTTFAPEAGRDQQKH